jgi:hypothetical protein
MKNNKKDNYTKGFGILLFFWIYYLFEYIRWLELMDSL